MTKLSTSIPQNAPSVKQSRPPIADATLSPDAPWETAEELLSYGYIPLMCEPGTKHPYYPYKAYRDGEQHVTPETIATWRREYPKSTNIVLACGPAAGYFVIETDSPAGRRVFKSLGGYDVETPRWRSGSGRGEHAVFKCPPDVNKHIVRLMPGMDILAKSVAVAPPSIHESGNRYTEITPLSTPIADCPPDLLEAIREEIARHNDGKPSRVKDDDATPPMVTDSDGPRSVTTHALSTDDDAVLAGIARALGIRRPRPGEWIKCHCPFHPDGTESASWTEDGGGQLRCHATDCAPGPQHVSHGRPAYGRIDTATKLGVPLPLHAPPPQVLSAHAFAHAQKPNGALSADALQTVPKNGKGTYLHECAAGIPNIYTRQPSVQLSQLGGGKARNAPQRAYMLLDIRAWADASGVEWTWRALTREDLSSDAAYRRAAYATFPEGIYSRSALAARVGVAASTSRRYDQDCGIAVERRTKRTVLPDDARLPNDRKDTPPSVWLESTAGTKYPPTEAGRRAAIKASVEHDGRAIAVKVRQLMSRYSPPEWDSARVGLPVELRQWLCQHNMATLGRAADATYMSGVAPGHAALSWRILEAGDQYGLSKHVMYRALRQARELASASHAETAPGKGEAVSTFIAHAEPREEPREAETVSAPPPVSAEPSSDSTATAAETGQLPLESSYRHDVCPECGKPGEVTLTGVCHDCHMAAFPATSSNCHSHLHNTGEAEHVPALIMGDAEP